jgi:hypothetical protein
MSMRGEQSHSHRGSYAEVWEATGRALVHLGMTISSADPASGTLTASASLSLMSWGENLQVRVAAVDPTTTAVSVGSSLKFGLVDWGKNRKNIDRIHETIAAALAAGSGAAPGPSVAPSAPQGGWHPDPAGRHELRWWDGQRWTESVSDAGTPGSDPL